MTRRKLFDIMQQQNCPTINEKLHFLENYLLGYEDYNEQERTEIKHNFSRFKSELKSRWIAAYKKKETFLKNNGNWLEGTFEIPKIVNRPGRPTKPFGGLSDRSKRRKTESLRSSTDVEVLTHAAQLKLGTSGKRDAAQVLKELTTSPKRATKYKRAFAKTQQMGKERMQMAPLQALSLFVEAGLSRSQYEIIRNSQKKLYPCYSFLQRAKMDCYPDKETYHVTDTCAEINIQALLDLTVTRLLMYLDEVLHTLNEEERRTLIIICKWGCDGSQQAQYKQKFQNDSDSDTNIFQCSFVPLQLACGTNNKIIWQNPTPSSPRYCRPMRIRFVKESADIINEEINYIKTALNSVQPSEVTLENKTFFVKHTMMLTMVDGKVCNAATSTKSTMRCYICGLTSKDFNDLSQKSKVKPEALEFGLSILHARIRIFESLLHVAYRLPIKKWRLNTEAENIIVNQRKADIQQNFRTQLGLIVDVPKPGYGNTNDGNTSRRFFIDPSLAAEITGIDENLIYRFKVILETISSGHKIHLEKFTEYTRKTAELYVQLYSWYPMTPTMHKILIHGPNVIEQAILPIGQLSEEAAEARNKHFRLFRQNFARKFSRVSCNQDVLNRLLLSSDPILTGMRPTARKKTKSFLKDTVEMLLPAEPCEPHDTEESDDEEADTDPELSSDEESSSSS